MSANILWQWTSMQPFNRSYIIVFLGCVLKRLRVEKLRSDVRDSYFLIMEAQLIHQKLNQLKFCEVVFGKIKESYLLFYKSRGGWRAPQQPLPASAAYANQFQMKGPSQLFPLNRCCHRVHRILLAKKSCPDYSHVSRGLIFSSVKFLFVLVLLSYIIIPKPKRKKNWIYSLNKG